VTLTTLPDVFHVDRCDARVIADALVAYLRSSRTPRILLYIAPNGDVMYATTDSEPACGPLSLVGCYTGTSTATAIVEDILAMEREPIA
jgi:hypothetical protein